MLNNNTYLINIPRFIQCNPPSNSIMCSLQDLVFQSMEAARVVTLVRLPATTDINKNTFSFYSAVH